MSQMVTRNVAMSSVQPKPVFYVVQSDDDRWCVEAEWTDGTIERIDTFEAHVDATSWITTRSDEWVRGRT